MKITLEVSVLAILAPGTQNFMDNMQEVAWAYLNQQHVPIWCTLIDSIGLESYFV